MNIDINKISYWELLRTACAGTAISVAITAVFVAVVMTWG
jgi:hypothetical protein